MCVKSFMEFETLLNQYSPIVGKVSIPMVYYFYYFIFHLVHTE
jgi:hypothetical protein